MSKLAHSNQETMDALDTLRAIANGDEDIVIEHLKRVIEDARELKRKQELADWYTTYDNMCED